MTEFKTELNTVHNYNMLSHNDGIVVGVSGGQDSVYLLHFLSSIKHSYSLSLYVAHINHNIRGEEADRDQSFVEELCKTLALPCYVKSVDVPSLAKEQGKTVEECGRYVRYLYFSEIMKKTGATKIATAHHKNDCTETILMNIIRGTGLHGLCGIPAVRGNIIRPLIETSRADITKYLNTNNIQYVTDSTNSQNSYFRNSIRNCLIPQIRETYNPRFEQSLGNLSDIACGINDFIKTEVLSKQKIETDDYGVFIMLTELVTHNRIVLSYVIHDMLAELSGSSYDISFEHYMSVLNLIEEGVTGKRVSLPFGMEAEIVYDKLYLTYPKSTAPFSQQLPDDGTVMLPSINLTLTCFVRDSSYLPASNEIALNYSNIEGKTLRVRNRMIGDRFKPSGMHGTKKLKDYFIDSKTPQFVRQRIPVITANDVIAAVGFRIAEDYKTDGSNRQFIIRIEHV